MSSDKYEHGRAGRGGGAEAGASKPGLWRQNLQYGKDLNFGLFFVPSFGIGGALRRCRGAVCATKPPRANSTILVGGRAGFSHPNAFGLGRPEHFNIERTIAWTIDQAANAIAL